MGGDPTVNGNLFTRNKRCLVRSQEENGVGNLFGLAHTPERMCVGLNLPKRISVITPSELGHAGVYRSGTDAVDADIIFRVFKRG